MPPRPNRRTIEAVAAELVACRQLERPVALVAGAGCSITSGVPLWEQFAADVCAKLQVSPRKRSSAINRLERHVSSSQTSRDLVEGLIETTLSRAHPSLGYRYLARLIQHGFYSTVITTNWDWLLEDALYRVMGAKQILVLSRDAAPDEQLAKLLETAGKRTVIVKVHGDPMTRLRLGDGTSTRALGKPLIEALRRRFCKVHVVGSSGGDTDILQLLFDEVESAEILVVAPHTARIGASFKKLATSICGDAEKLSALRYRPKIRGVVDAPQADQWINVGEFDHFFCQVSLSIERRLLRDGERAHKLASVEDRLLKKEETGLSYFNYNQITRMTEVFVGQVTRDDTPDVVFFVNDPSAPGGMELKKRIESELADKGIQVGVLLIHGEHSNRSFKRQFRGKGGPPPGKKVRRVHILDSITFSGNTLEIAKAQVRRWYPDAKVRLGVLVVSQLLVDGQTGKPERERIYYETVTDRFEVFFPWGVTQATADFDRKFSGVDGDRLVHIARRPWGAVEILADEELCSVRLLTIEANRRLSFQRHLCRDELFVALDDNIGIDVCAAELETDVDQFNPAVKSMILEKGDYILISRGIWHRTKASMDRVRLLEVGFGIYDQQYDIDRLFDDFERVEADGAK